MKVASLFSVREPARTVGVVRFTACVVFKKIAGGRYAQCFGFALFPGSRLRRPPSPVGSQDCPTPPPPGAGWTCVNGGWVPPPFPPIPPEPLPPVPQVIGL